MFDIGNRVIYLRKLHNISANKLSKELKVDPSTINKIEKGTAKPSMDLLFNICEHFQISLADFFADPQEQEPVAPEVQQVCEKVKRLPPRRIQILNAVLDDWLNDD